MSFETENQINIEEGTVVPVVIGHFKSLPVYKSIITKTFSDISYDNALESLRLLDKEYGNTRDIFNDDGGYIGFIYNKDSLNYFNHLSNDLMTRPNYEIIYKLDDKCYKILFLTNNEFGITVYITVEWLEHYAKTVCKCRLEDLDIEAI